MKLQVTKEALAPSLNLATRAVAVKAALPVLNNILLSCENGQLKLAATDLETSITTSLSHKSVCDPAIGFGIFEKFFVVVFVGILLVFWTIVKFIVFFVRRLLKHGVRSRHIE